MINIIGKKNIMERKTIILTPYERVEFEKFCTSNIHNVRLIRRAKIILALDTSESRTTEPYRTIAKRLGVSLQTINNVKRDFLILNNISFLKRKQRKFPPIPPKITGDIEDRIVELIYKYTLTNQKSPTSRLMAELCVKEGIVDRISHMTIYRIFRSRFPNYPYKQKY